MNNQKLESKNEKQINEDKLELNTEKKNKLNIKNDKNKIDINNKKYQIIDLRKKISNVKNDITDIQLRGQAKIENIRKKSEQNIKMIKNSQLEKFAKKILPIIDSLEEILKIADQKKNQETIMVQGISLTLKSMLNVISKFGIKREGHKNTIFQSNLHQPILSKKSKNTQSNHIISVIQHGYTLNGTVLRKAKVEISL
ncbi:nucleotide exchange factor GrpE [Buchnera aphidicola (Pemphigus obesinymphae)]|uniref:nucleotide exchange factor GrpE n=1 Tax=Buchnera aphidicola TaxID=9 RepID=UPI002237309F|nr:nucleotide exchange factor GrpE [Buchnera aphidicola]MCW5196639.1 nucleotide exchange factor GrpE [Buchnera aphidicola (Pemphigus obesinymphae)]